MLFKIKTCFYLFFVFLHLQTTSAQQCENLFQADMRQMPFIANSTVDKLFCLACPGAMNFFNEVISEARRNLKVGGTFKITSNSSILPWINSLQQHGFQIEIQNDRSVLARKISQD